MPGVLQAWTLLGGTIEAQSVLSPQQATALESLIPPPAYNGRDALLLHQRCRIAVGGHNVGVQRGVPSSGDHGGLRACGEGKVWKLKDFDSVVHKVRIFSEEVDS